MVHARLAVVASMLASLGLSASASAQALEYIAHACFIVESSRGTRIAIDPYNGYRWLGYGFPEGLKADAVLVSHPHYDHDASYYFGADTPVFRAAGRFQVNDVTVTGVAGRHADPYGAEFGQINTLWVVETDGVRIAHLGDTGPLSPEALAALGRVDVLLVPVDGQEHILKYGEVAAIRAALRPRVTIPMHYRIAGLTELPDSLGPVEPFLSSESRVRRLDSHRATLPMAGDPPTGSGAVWVLPPSAAVRPWSASLTEAWGHLRTARQLLREKPGDRAAREEATARLKDAVRLAPGVSVFADELASVLSAGGDTGGAERVLEQSLAGGARHDWEFTLRSRLRLATLYADRGARGQAEEQCRIVLAQSHRLAERAQAEALLARIGGR